MNLLGTKKNSPHLTSRNLNLPAALSDAAVPGSKINECMLFHGATIEGCQDISKSGFEPERGGEKAGKLFGKGTYLTNIFSKADQYTDTNFSMRQTETKTKERCVLVVRAIVGAPYIRLQVCQGN